MASIKEVVVMMMICCCCGGGVAGNKDMETAIEEMERANYFTFVMLLNMVPPDLFQGRNLTFLMPTDKSLSRSSSNIVGSVEDLLLRHSIPSPLLFDHLLHFPTNTMLPTSNPDLMLRVSNNGRMGGFFLGNVRIVTPNVCTHANSVRCHGIDAVLTPHLQTSPIANCSIPPPHTIDASPPHSYQTSSSAAHPHMAHHSSIIYIVWAALILAY